MTSAASVSKRSIDPFRVLIFVSAAVAVWAGLDAANFWIAFLSTVVLVPATYQLFDKFSAQASGGLSSFYRSRPLLVAAVQVCASAALLWLAIDVSSTLGVLAGAALTLSTVISLIKGYPQA